VITADLAVKRTDQRPVGAQQTDQHEAHSAHAPGRGATQAAVEVGTEAGVRRPDGGWERTDDHVAPVRKTRQALAAQVAESALDTMTEHGVADGSTDHEPDPDRVTRVPTDQVHDQGVAAGTVAGTGDQAEVSTAGEPVDRR
jgi:hypothetical protein